MPGSRDVLIHRGVRLNYERLCAAIQEGTSDRATNATQLEAIAELQACRAQIASPLDPLAEKKPSPEDRSRLSASGGVTILVGGEASDASADAAPIRLGADLVSVAIALSDELKINEVDAAVLLFDARSRAAHRTDNDVVSAAKELFSLRRRESILYLQEVLRAGLHVVEGDLVHDTFTDLLLKERDILLTDNNVFANITRRLRDGFTASLPPSRCTDSLTPTLSEQVMFAELLFLIAYTIQLSGPEASTIYSLLTQADELHRKLKIQEHGKSHSSRRVSAPPLANAHVGGSMDRYPEAVLSSPDLVKVETIRNLNFLSWTTALDRSRYHNVYDPRTGQTGVNSLLKDLSFISSTCHVPKLADGEEDSVKDLPNVMASAELSAAVFRLATASPDESEAVTTFLRVTVYAESLSFLSRELPNWIEKGAGSMSPDADLYADVLEDLALDIAEAPGLVGSLIQFAQNDIHAAASQAAYDSFKGLGGNRGRERVSLRSPAESGGLHGTTKVTSPHARRASYQPSGGKPPPRPPFPPSMRPSSSMRVPTRPSMTSSGAIQWRAEERELGAGLGAEDRSMSEMPATTLISSLTVFVARAIALAPSKLRNDSIGGGMRYWVGVGQLAPGFIPRIGDAIIDLWDAAMRNPSAPGGIGEAFRLALEAFLLLLANTSRKEGSPTHAAAALRYLDHGGHPVVSLERVSGAVSYIHDSLTSSAAQNVELEDAESNALCGILDIISTAAEALSSHGGTGPIIGDSVKDFAIRLASLVVLNVPLQLKDSLLRTVRCLGHRRSIAMLLETLGYDKATKPRRSIRSSEAQAGTYVTSIRVMELVKVCVGWLDDYPDEAIESLSSWYVVEEVLAFWTRRMYATEEQRWEVIATAADTLLAVICKDPTSTSAMRTVALLLSPAPGTGAACYALQALALGSGLIKSGENKGEVSAVGAGGDSSAGLFGVCGRDLLVYAVEHGLGKTYREMQKAVWATSRLLSVLLSVPPGRVTVPGVVVAPTVDLLLGEAHAITCWSSLVFVPNAFDPVLSRAGYSSSVCAALLAMIARAARDSEQIATLLTEDRHGLSGSALQFRASLARIIVNHSAEARWSCESDMKSNGRAVHDVFQDPPIVHSVLRIVEACLGPDGGGTPGLFLLGLRNDKSGRCVSADYGVLGALVELIAGGSPMSGCNEASRSTAATFLERLAANTVQSTSFAVLEHIQAVTGADRKVRGSGFADEMLHRLIETALNENGSSDVDWSSFPELFAACLKLSALQVRLFPQQEGGEGRHVPAETHGEQLGGEADFLHQSEIMSSHPSPIDMLHVLALASSSGNEPAHFDAFRAWYQLLGTRIAVHPPNVGLSSASLLYELAAMLLNALSGSSNDNLAELVLIDGGAVAAAAILDCVKKIGDCVDRSGAKREPALTDTQSIGLIKGLTRALAKLFESGARTTSARTLLHASLLTCGKTLRGIASQELLTRALEGRLGDRKMSGTEVVIMVASGDAISGQTAAAKTAAIAVMALATSCDPHMAMVALIAQNRLRRVLHSSLSNPEAGQLIAKACCMQQGSDTTQDVTEERASLAIAEAVLALIHSISLASHGARVLADAGCVESVASLLSLFERGPFSSSTGGLLQDAPHLDSSASQASREQHLHTVEPASIPENCRLSLIAAITGAIAAAIRCAGAAVIEDAILALDQGKHIFTDMLRRLDLPGTDQLKAISCLGMILSRIPQQAFLAASSCSYLRICLASAVSRIVPPVSKVYHLGASGSLLSAGINLRSPDSARAARRIRVLHPEGGSLFERDLVASRASCVQSVISTLRNPDGMLLLFSPSLVEKTRKELAGTTDDLASSMGRLSDVLRICKVMFREFQRAMEESNRLERQVAGEIRTSMTPRRLNELSAYCEEEFGVGSDNVTGYAVEDLLKKAAETSKGHADVCVSVLEGCLIILREFVCAARDTSRGQVFMRDGFGGDEGMNLVGQGDSRDFSIDTATTFLTDAKNVLVPFCREIENVQGDLWGRTDGSFSKQVCRQIRASCTGKE